MTRPQFITEEAAVDGALWWTGPGAHGPVAPTGEPPSHQDVSFHSRQPDVSELFHLHSRHSALATHGGEVKFHKIPENKCSLEAGKG